MFAALSDDELLRQSDLIVIGRWAGVEPPAAGAPAGTPAAGRIEVAELLRGPAGLKQVRVAVPAPGAFVSSSDLPRRPGDQGLWLLRQRPGQPAELYLADHPQRFVPAADAARIQALRQRIMTAR